MANTFANYNLNWVDGDAGYQPNPRTATAYNLAHFAPSFRRRAYTAGDDESHIVSAWDPLHLYNRLGAITSCINGYVDDPYARRHFTGIVSAADIATAWADTKELQATGCVMASRSAWTEGLITNYSLRANPNTFRPGAVQTESYDPHQTESYVAACQSGSPLRLSTWQNGIWPRLGDMDVVMPSRTKHHHCTINLSNEWTTTVIYDRTGNVSMDPSYTTRIYWHTARVQGVQFAAEWGWADLWNARGQIRQGPGPSFAGFSVPARYITFDASRYPIFAIFRVFKRKTTWDLTTSARRSTKTEVTKYVLADISDYVLFTEDDARHPYHMQFAAFSLLAMKDHILQLAGVADDVVLPTFETPTQELNAQIQTAGDFWGDELIIDLAEMLPFGLA